MLKHLGALLCVSALAACAAPRPMQMNGEQLAAAPLRGSVIVAVTLDSLNPDNARAILTISGNGQQRQVYASEALNFIRAPGNTPDARGELALVELPPGDYRIEGVRGEWREPWIGAMEPMWHYINVPLNAAFHLNEGEVLYLGDVHLSLNYRPTARITDQSRRDFNHMNSVWHVPDTSNVVVKVPTAQGAQPTASTM
ncbi:hypothetical protein [Andreprevotia chitinilytica]|uniref:hypothetical protein n=1 Tax=Andreprevotia chitinilytica TaxID=396808 RepID=UPI00054E3852|nr:hypothetical protein [Andreprevotia chitinilytica]